MVGFPSRACRREQTGEGRCSRGTQVGARPISSLGTFTPPPKQERSLSPLQHGGLLAGKCDGATPPSALSRLLRGSGFLRALLGTLLVFLSEKGWLPYGEMFWVGNKSVRKEILLSQAVLQFGNVLKNMQNIKIMSGPFNFRGGLSPCWLKSNQPIKNCHIFNVGMNQTLLIKR